MDKKFFVLCDLEVRTSDIVQIDKFLRNIPFSIKETIKGSGRSMLIYKNLFLQTTMKQENYFNYNIQVNQPKDSKITDDLILKIINYMVHSCDDKKTIDYVIDGLEKNNIYMTLTPIKIVDLKNIKIMYTDGSVNNKTKICGFGLCELFHIDDQLDDQSCDVGIDDLTGEKFAYKTYSGTKTNGTNNIGELLGIKKAVEIAENDVDNEIYIILSDSQYGVKCFREWIYDWEKNNYLNSSRKPIKNKELIKSIQNLRTKPILFGWTKSHSNIFFNKLCDQLAKNAVK